jgi:hypothetical protein
MKYISILLLIAILFIPLQARATEKIEPTDLLADGFLNPPKAAKPSIYWLWLNGYVNRSYLETELKQFSEKGIGGLCIFDMGARGDIRAIPPAGPAFMSDKFVDNVAYALELACKFNLDVELAACSSWDLGGSWVWPQQASMGLYHARIQVKGPVDYDELLPMPELPANIPRTLNGKPAFMKNVAVLAIPETGRKFVTRDSDLTARTVSDGLGADWPPALVIEDRSQILNITDHLSFEGKLIWKVPPGEWTIIRFICANTGEKLKVPSPNSDGLATDHFSREATRAFIQYITGRLKQKLGDLRLTPLKQLYLPSYEVKGATWTPDFIEQFKKYCHYDMTPYLPALAGCVIENQDITSRFLYDYRKMLGDLLVDAYYRTASETAHEAGLGIEAEAGGPGPPVHQVPVDALKALGSIDEMRGEFWPWRQQRNQLWVVKETACAAHIYGRKRVNMESFTGFRHWQDGPFDLKPAADRAFCEGMNHVVWHTSSHQPPEAGKPGWVYGAGTHLTPNIAWWSKVKPFIDYLSRCSFMLQQGQFVADVCYYYGDQGFNFVPAKHIDPSHGYGYDYDVANAEVILGWMSVKDGRFVLPDGMQYELLVLPDRKDMNLQVLQKIKELVAAGGTVVGLKPTQSNGLTDYPTKDQQVKQLADTLWGNCDGKNVIEHQYGKGKIVWGRSLREILLARGISPDFHYTGDEKTDLDFIHRRTPEADIYFIRNKKNRREFVNAYFRVSAKSPKLWLPDTGAILQGPAYEQTPEGVRVPLKLAPFGSIFVVFRKSLSQPHLVSLDPWIDAKTVNEGEIKVTAFENGSYKMKTSDGRTVGFEIDRIPSALQITGPWEVHFPDGWGTPEAVTFAELKSWTEHKNLGIRNFSGTACYEKEFLIPRQWFGQGRKIYLDLGILWAVGQVTLNGQSLGVVWKPPYRVEITKAAVAGQNKLEIEITNTWANRLVGDAQLPPEKRYCRTNITSSGTPGKPWKDIPLRESGLLGPVELIQSVEKTVSLTK